MLATNGNSNLPEFSGSDDGVLGVACTGATPRTGPNIPAQVVTQLRSDLTYLRILHNTGSPLNGSVRINCVLEVESRGDTHQAPRRDRQAIGLTRRRDTGIAGRESGSHRPANES